MELITESKLLDNIKLSMQIKKFEMNYKSDLKRRVSVDWKFSKAKEVHPEHKDLIDQHINNLKKSMELYRVYRIAEIKSKYDPDIDYEKLRLEWVKSIKYTKRTTGKKMADLNLFRV